MIKSNPAIAWLKITSPVFVHNGLIPEKYTCDGENINPPLEIADVPPGTKSIVLIVEDPDAPMGTWIHWVKYNMPATSPVTIIPENVDEKIKKDQNFGDPAKGSGGKVTYYGPCPPSDIHRYYFKMYALDTKLKPNLNAGGRTIDFPDKPMIYGLMDGHVLAQGEIIGRYAKKGM